MYVYWLIVRNFLNNVSIIGQNMDECKNFAVDNVNNGTLLVKPKPFRFWVFYFKFRVSLGFSIGVIQEGIMADHLSQDCRITRSVFSVQWIRVFQNIGYCQLHMSVWKSAALTQNIADFFLSIAMTTWCFTIQYPLIRNNTQHGFMYRSIFSFINIRF